MKRIQETGNIGYSRYSLGLNKNGWRLFFVNTSDPRIYDMMTYLCTLSNIDEEVSDLVKRRDFNYINIEDVEKIHHKYFKEKEN